MMNFKFLLLVGGLIAAAGSASASCGGTVKFAPGSSSGVMKGTVTGYETCDYTLTAQQGQKLSASLAKQNGLDVIMLDPVEHDFANGALTLPKNGRYTVRVLQSRNDARKGKSRNFALTVGVSGAAAAKPAAAKIAKPAKAANCEGSGTLRNGTANISGSLAGSDVCYYTLSARAGQSVELLIDAKPGVEVWLREPGSDTAVQLDPSFRQKLEKSGDYAVSVARNRNDARKGGTRDFSAVLNVE